LLSGTRAIEVTMTMICAAGTHNNGYVDAISVHLTGPARGQIFVESIRDPSAETVAKATGIGLLAGSPANATFSAVQFDTDLITSAARIEGSSELDTLTVSLAPNGSFSAKTFFFQNWNNEADTLVSTGATGAENLTGSLRADRVEFWVGGDTVPGLAGDDSIDDGTGLDRLRCGGGAYSFVLTNRQNSRHALQDFDAGDDQLIVRAELFTADQRFVWDKVTGKLWSDLDGLDAAAVAQIATLSGTPSLSPDDFLIVRPCARLANCRTRVTTG
jgi:hypothetical protein